MPRIYDFQNDDPKARETAYVNWDAFPRHPEPAYGRGEVDLSDVYPGGGGPSSWIRPSFSRTNADKAIYDNEANDRIHAWLSEHSTARWHWREESVNHGHSVSIDVWIESPEDRGAFAATWGELFTRDLEVESRNERILEASMRRQAEATTPSLR